MTFKKKKPAAEEMGEAVPDPESQAEDDQAAYKSKDPARKALKRKAFLQAMMKKSGK